MLCRVCLNEPEHYVEITEEILVKLEFCIKTNLLRNLNTPTSLCLDCSDKLDVAFDFISKVAAADIYFDRLPTSKPDIKSEVKIENIDFTDGKLELNDEFYFEDDDEEDFFDDDVKQSEDENTLTEVTIKRERKSRNHNKETIKDNPTTKYSCQKCGLKCKHPFELKKHKRLHTGGRPYICFHCHKSFRNKFNIERHIQISHVKNVELYQKFIRKIDGNFICKYCKLKVVSESAMIIHIRTHTNERPFPCHICTKSFKTTYSLQQHTKTHLKRPKFSQYICDFCNKIFSSKNSIKIHLRIHMNSRPHQCEYCEQTFTQIGSYIRHKRAKHTKEKTHLCDTCGKGFTDKSALRHHEIVHVKTTPFKCDLCDKAMKTKNALKCHIKRHDSIESFTCNGCSKSFYSIFNLRKHERVFHTERSGFCFQCKRHYADISIHNDSKHSDKRERPFSCDICQMKFVRKPNLEVHMKHMHYETDKFICPHEMCNQGFSTLVKLNYHIMKVHTKDTPFPCNYCSYRFRRECDLKRHIGLKHRLTLFKTNEILE